MVRLLRSTLGLLVIPLLGGCLVQEPPDLDDPEQTRPFVLVREVTPSPALVKPIPAPTEGTSIQYFVIPIQSEDSEPVKGALHFDLKCESERWLDSKVIEASTFDQGPRVMTLEWEVRSRRIEDDLGCHRLTAVFAHLSDFDESEQLVAEEAKASSESISWLVNVHTGDTDPTILVDCPRDETCGFGE